MALIRRHVSPLEKIQRELMFQEADGMTAVHLLEQKWRAHGMKVPCAERAPRAHAKWAARERAITARLARAREDLDQTLRMRARLGL